MFSAILLHFTLFSALKSIAEPQLSFLSKMLKLQQTVQKSEVKAMMWSLSNVGSPLKSFKYSSSAAAFSRRHVFEDIPPIEYVCVIKTQAELRTCKAKVKLKGQMASQQDNLLLERQTAIDRTLQENNTLKQEVTVVKEDNDSLNKKVG